MSQKVNTVDQLPLKAVARVSVEKLVLDRQNPRLATIISDPDDVKIIAQLYRTEDLGELLQSIATNGYLDIEPLIVLKEQDHLLVLEGNRRLAAIRLLQEPELAKKIKESQRLQITIPKITEQHKKTLNFVSVYRVASREDARSFIGFKHINGAAKWESYVKAKFAADWYRCGKISLSDIADRIGDRHDTVKRMVNAIYVLEQAESQNIFQVDDRASPRFNFSHLYTALSRAPYLKFLGLAPTWSSYEPSPNPVPNEKAENLSEILKWIYGSKEDSFDPVVKSQNPDIKYLGEILESGEGLAILRAKKSLQEAYESTKSVGLKLSEALIKTRSTIREASHNLRGFDGIDKALFHIVEDILETVEAILGQMKKKVKKAKAEEIENE